MMIDVQLRMGFKGTMYSFRGRPRSFSLQLSWKMSFCKWMTLLVPWLPWLIFMRSIGSTVGTSEIASDPVGLWPVNPTPDVKCLVV